MEQQNLFEKKYYAPTDEINGFKIRPGNYLSNGASVVDGGVNFTVHSYGATSCSLCLFHRMEDEPYAVIHFPESYRIGNTYSMIVFDIDPTEFEYAYTFDGEYNPDHGLLFDKNNYILDPYAKAVTGQSVWERRLVRMWKNLAFTKRELWKTRMTGEILSNLIWNPRT